MLFNNIISSFKNYSKIDSTVIFVLLNTSRKDDVNELHDQFKKFDVTQSGFIESEDLRIMKELRRRRNTTTTTTTISPTYI